MPLWPEVVHKVPEVQTLVTVRAFSKTLRRISGVRPLLAALASSSTVDEREASPLTAVADVRVAAFKEGCWDEASWSVPCVGVRCNGRDVSGSEE